MRGPAAPDTLAGVRHAPAGYSLVDLLVALAVGGGLMASTLTLLHLGLRAWVWGAARVEAQQSARYAVERMASELREAGYDPTVAGIAPVVLAEPARVVFQRDFNGNGVVDPTRERVTYLLRPGETILRRDAGGGAQPVVEQVRAFRAHLSRPRRRRDDRSGRGDRGAHPARGRRDGIRGASWRRRPRSGNLLW